MDTTNYALIGRYDDAIYKLANGIYVDRCTYTSGTTTGTMYVHMCIYIYMSCGRNYVHGELAMSKLGGPRLSVVKVLNFLSFHYLK